MSERKVSVSASLLVAIGAGLLILGVLFWLFGFWKVFGVFVSAIVALFAVGLVLSVTEQRAKRKQQ